MDEDLREQMHKPMYYQHVLIRDKDGAWVFFDDPVIFTPLNISAAQGMIEVIMRKALFECPWIRIPLPGQPASECDMMTVQAPTIEAFTLMNLNEIR